MNWLSSTALYFIIIVRLLYIHYYFDTMTFIAMPLDLKKINGFCNLCRDICFVENIRMLRRNFNIYVNKYQGNWRVLFEYYWVFIPGILKLKYICQNELTKVKYQVSHILRFIIIVFDRPRTNSGLFVHKPENGRWTSNTLPFINPHLPLFADRGDLYICFSLNSTFPKLTLYWMSWDMYTLRLCF